MDCITYTTGKKMHKKFFLFLDKMPIVILREIQYTISRNKSHTLRKVTRKKSFIQKNPCRIMLDYEIIGFFNWKSRTYFTISKYNKKNMEAQAVFFVTTDEIQSSERRRTIKHAALQSAVIQRRQKEDT